MLHPANHLSSHCITSMVTLLLSCRSSQLEPVTLYTAALDTDQRLVAETTYAYQTTQGATEILTPLVASPTPFPQGILRLILLVHFMQEATSSLLLMLKYSTKQQLRTNKQYTVQCSLLTDRLLKYSKFKMVITAFPIFL